MSSASVQPLSPVPQPGLPGHGSRLLAPPSRWQHLGLVTAGAAVGLALGVAGGASLVGAHAATGTTLAAAPRSDRRAAAPSTAVSPSASERGLVGVLAATRAVEVRALTEGRILRVNVALGDRVTAGQSLASLDPEPLRQELQMARAAVANARASKARAAAELGQSRSSRRRTLALGAYASTEERTNARFVVISRAADLQAADATIEERLARLAQVTNALENLEIRAPFDGVVAQCSVEVGATVGREAPVVKLMAEDGLLVRFAVDPDRAGEVQLSRTVSVVLPATGARARAVVERIAPESDGAQMIVAEGRLDAPPPTAGFTPGLMVRVVPAASPPSRSKP